MAKFKTAKQRKWFFATLKSRMKKKKGSFGNKKSGDSIKSKLKSMLPRAKAKTSRSRSFETENAVGQSYVPKVKTAKAGRAEEAANKAYMAGIQKRLKM